MVILSYALCLSLGSCIGFAVAGFFANSLIRKSDLRLTNTRRTTGWEQRSKSKQEKRSPAGETGAQQTEGGASGGVGSADCNAEWT